LRDYRERGFPFSARYFCCERRVFPQTVDCCEESPVFSPDGSFEGAGTFAARSASKTESFFDEDRRDFCCEERFPRRVFSTERRTFAVRTAGFSPYVVFFDETPGLFAREEAAGFSPEGLSEERRDFWLFSSPAPSCIPVSITNAGYYALNHYASHVRIRVEGRRNEHKGHGLPLPPL